MTWSILETAGREARRPAISAAFVGMPVVFVTRHRIVRTPQGVTWVKVRRVTDSSD